MLALKQIDDVSRQSIVAVLDDGSPPPAPFGGRPGEPVTQLQVKTAHEKRGLFGSEQDHTLAGPEVPYRIECRALHTACGLTRNVHDLRTRLSH